MLRKSSSKYYIFSIHCICCVTNHFLAAARNTNGCAWYAPKLVKFGKNPALGFSRASPSTFYPARKTPSSRGTETPDAWRKPKENWGTRRVVRKTTGLSSTEGIPAPKAVTVHHNLHQFQNHCNISLEHFYRHAGTRPTGAAVPDLQQANQFGGIANFERFRTDEALCQQLDGGGEQELGRHRLENGCNFRREFRVVQERFCGQ